MEVAKLISALEEAISLLRNSQSSIWAHMDIDQLIAALETEIVKAKNSQAVDSNLLKLLFAPTGAIQEVALDNGWAEQYLRISGIIGQ